VSNTVTLTFKIAQDGSLKAIGQEAEKTAKQTDAATKSAGNYNKGQKGVAQAGMNSTKAFSKMQGAMGSGGSGLVGAYAGLAANVFALTAAFGALSRASRATQLEEGLVVMGQASGLAMRTLSTGLVEATGHAISLEEAMRSVALITSAGIDPGSIDRFGKVARGAATALGRDLNDAMSRLTRGVTKLEPELLDELGIMVRLDEASKTYADSIGKSVSDLTNYEKRQAFLNATLEEGERKFGALAEVDVNVFDKLSASLANLLKGGLGGLSSMLEPIVRYLASSPGALIGVLAMFAATISGAVVGSLSEMAEGAANATNATLDYMTGNMKAAAGLATNSETVENFTQVLEEGGDISGAYTKAIDGQEMSVISNTGNAKRWGLTQEELNRRLDNSKIIVTELGNATRQYGLEATQSASATAIAAFAQGDLIGGLKGTWATLKGVGLTMKLSVLTTTSLKTAFQGLTVSAKAAGVALKTMGAGVMAMLGPLGIAYTVITLLIDVLKGLYNMFRSEESKKLEEATTALSDAHKELAVNIKEVDDAFAGTSNKIFGTIAAYTAMDNVLSQFNDKFKDVKDASIAAGDFSDAVKAQQAIIKSSAKLTTAYETANIAAKLAATDYFDAEAKSTVLEEFLKEQHNVAKAFTALGEASKGAKDGVTDYLNAKQVKTDVDEVLGGLTQLRKSLMEQTSDTDSTLIIKPALLIDGTLSDTLNDALTGDMAVTYGLTKQKAALAAVDKKRETALKAQNAAIKEMDSLSSTYMGKERKLHGISQTRYDAAKTARDEAKAAFEEANTAATGEEANIIKAIRLEEIRVRDLQTKLITQKQTLATAKAESATAKELAANTEANLKRRQAKTKAVQTVELEMATDRKAALLLEETRLADQLAADKENVEVQKQVTQNAADLAVATADVALKTAVINSALEDELELKKTLLDKTKEDQLAQRAVLDISKKAISAAKEQLDIEQKMAQLQQKINNRRTGADDSESQKLAIQLDEKVVAKKIAFIAREAQLKKSQVQLEKTLLIAKMNHLKAEIDVLNEKRAKDGTAPIPTADLVSTITSLSENGGLFDVQIQNITNNATLLTQELLFQVASTNIIAIQAAERLKNEQAVRDVAREESEIRGSMLAGAIKMAEVSNKMAQNSNTNLFGDPKSNTVAAKLAKEANQLKVVAAKAEYDQKIIMHNLDMEVLYAKFELLKAEAEADGRITKQEAAMLNAHQKVLNAKVAASKQEVKAAGQAVNLAKSEAAIANKQALGAASSEGFAAVMQTLSGQKAAEDQKLADKKKAEDKETFKAGVLEGFDQSSIANRQVELLQIIADALTGTDNTVDAITNGTNNVLAGSQDAVGVKENIVAGQVGEGGAPAESLITSGDKESSPVMEKVTEVEKLQASLKGAATSMRALGPDGEGPAAMFDGLNTMSTAFEKGKSKGEMMSSALAGIGQVMAGASQMKVNAIDKEIAAEQKRDGKSKASMAKIAALEKKKDAIKKKQFEINKKISMAQVVIATATGVMETMKAGGFFASPLAMAVAAMGAAQLAIIAGTSYQSAGGGGGGSQSPQKVSMGSRENTVDLAKGNSASGEMAYMRGEGGVGKGATNFKPTSAFSGYKNRNAGGYVVGEQGPELFMPETPGEIIPAGRLGGAEPTNVNFNISAVDAQGVEDVLVRQKGHIIRMIREAANEHGQPFLEDISDGSYTS
jgi:hypothetical protein